MRNIPNMLALMASKSMAGHKPTKRRLNKQEFMEYLDARRLSMFRGRNKPMAEALGISQQNLSSLINGKSFASEDICKRLSAIDPDFDLSMPEPHVEITLKKKSKKKT